MVRHSAFTLIEVLISILLLGLILPALYSSVDLLKDSNDRLLIYLEKAKKITQATDILYLDIASSDGNITIKKDEFTRLCMEETQNSLHGLPSAKVCWLVMKDGNTLVRSEGIGYSLPVRSEETIEVNSIMKGVELFDVYHEKDKVLVLLQQLGKEPITFMVQGITKPIVRKPKPKPKAKKRTKKKNTKDPKNTKDSKNQNDTKNPKEPIIQPEER